MHQNKMIDKIVEFLAVNLPDTCPTQKWLGISICKLNPLYEQVIRRKLELKGYEAIDQIEFY